MKHDELNAKLSEDEAPKTSIAKDPLTILKLVTVEPAPCSDPKIQMTIITFLGIFVCLVLCSAIGYFIAKHEELPTVIITFGSGALGALSGLLAPNSQR